jgi:hypothetical protein
MKPVHILALSAAFALAPTALTSQQPQPDPRAAALKSALRNLVIAQERYFVDHGSYTTDVAALGVFRRETPRDSIWVQVISAGGRSWNGRAIHSAARNKSCVIYVGLKTDLPSPPVTEADSVRATDEGAPVCDRL